MDLSIILLFAGGLVGGFVNGLTGFGTGLSAMPFWVHAVSPAIAAQLAAAGAVVAQLLTLRTIWHAISWQRVGPIIVAGLIGVPVGTLLLPAVPQHGFKLGVGIVLVVYSLFLLGLGHIRLPTRDRLVGDLVVGFGGGVMAGVAGLSGPLPTAWATLQGLPRDIRRALFQSFNLTILTAMLASSAVAGLTTWELGWALLISTPGTLIGTRLGLIVYRRLDDRRFDRLVLVMLLTSGVLLIAGNLAG